MKKILFQNNTNLCSMLKICVLYKLRNPSIKWISPVITHHSYSLDIYYLDPPLRSEIKMKENNYILLSCCNSENTSNKFSYNLYNIFFPS